MINREDILDMTDLTHEEIAAVANPRADFVIDLSTIGPDASRRAAKTLAARNIAFGDAPVSGGRSGAIKGTITLIFSGDMTKLDPFTLNVLCNAEVIAVNQDPLGQQARGEDGAPRSLRPRGAHGVAGEKPREPVRPVEQDEIQKRGRGREGGEQSPPLSVGAKCHGPKGTAT